MNNFVLRTKGTYCYPCTICENRGNDDVCAGCDMCDLSALQELGIMDDIRAVVKEVKNDEL